jgi:hypothetical protein
MWSPPESSHEIMSGAVFQKYSVFGAFPISRMNSPISRAISLRVFLSLRFIRLSGAIDQLLFDSTVWWFEPAHAQLRREIIHLSFICAIFVSKPVPDCNDPAFGQLSNIKCGEAPATG